LTAITAADPLQPAAISTTDVAGALAAGKVTISAEAIRFSAPLAFPPGGGHRLDLVTDLGGGPLGPVAFAQPVTMGASDQLYIRARAVDQCGGNSPAIYNGHVAINAYLGGVGAASSPLPQLLVQNLSGFSLQTEGGASATIVYACGLPLESFDHGLADSQDPIFVNGPLHLEPTSATNCPMRRRRRR
jgi:hypothetical protein